MAVLVTDPFLEDRLKADRAESGGDRFDEVWEGVYQMAPLANDDHQEIQSRFGDASGGIGLGFIREDPRRGECQ